jgi:flagellar motor switch protein FliN
MSTDKQDASGSKMQGYIQAWGDGIASVLQQVVAAPHAWEELSAQATTELLASLKDESVTIQFEAGQKFSGHQGFVLSKKVAVRLAQVLLAEPEDGASELTEERRDALGELFRQFAGTVASSLKVMVGGEVGFKWLGMDPFEGKPGAQTGLQWTSDGLTPVTMVAEMGADLIEALKPTAAAATPTAAQAFELPAAAPQLAAAPKRDPNLEMLMDVELDVTLRFGEREMVLHDILDLSAGSVVELDQHVQDHVELLVGKKVIARGEVVVVDGNYGLRVTEILSPKERIESLRN